MLHEAVAFGVLLCLGCGGPRISEPEGTPQAASTQTQEPSPSPSPSTSTSTLTRLDAGVPDDPVPDAGLAEIGLAPCEVTIGRFMRCRQVAEADKRLLSAQHDELKKRHETADRAELARQCIELARTLEQVLLEMGC